MPIQITREEYEKKFGVKPFVVSTTEDIVDTKPAPIKVTRAEWNAMQKPKAGQMGDFEQMGTNLNTSVGRAGRGIVDAFKNPDLGVADKLTVAGGKGIRGISDFLGDAFVGLAKLALPKSFENRIKEKFTEVVQEIKDAPKTDFRNSKSSDGFLISEKFGEKIDAAVESVYSGKDDFVDRRANDPRFKEITDAGGNYALGLADLVGAGKAQGVVDDALEAGINKTADIVPDIQKSITTALDNRTSLKRQQDLYNIENSYDKLRKDMNKSSDANGSSRARIADADIWKNVVDTDGKMTTLGRGGAYDQYQKATIDGRETIVRDNLVREGATVNINELAQALKISVANTNLEGAALASALKGVQREIDAFTKGLSKRTDEFGNIPLEKVQDFKTSTTKTIDYKKDNTPTITFKKAKAQAYKEVIENKSKVEVVVDGKTYNIKGLNAELAKYYKDLELISSLDGRRVKGGKLGKYFAQISGNIIGGAVGVAVGGPMGMALGTVVGGEGAGFIKGRMMASSLGKGGKGIPANPALDAARKQAGLPPVKNLEVPDAALGAPKSVPKTKEITKVEGQIKKNVAQQKAAIKTGNFGLVVELKEVYAYLVTQLKALIKSVVESAKNPTIGLSTKRVGIPEGTSYQDLVTMRDYTDMVYSKKTKLPEATIKAISDEMDSVARRLKLKNAFGSEDALAKEANNILKDAQFEEVLQSKSSGKRNTQYSKANITSKTDISKSSTQPREKNGQFGEKPKPAGIKEPTLKTKREVIAKDMAGNKVTIPQGEVITPYIDGAKVNITVGGKNYVIPKNQYQNLVGQSDVAKATPFAPELEGTVETINGATTKSIITSKQARARLEEKGIFIEKDMSGDANIVDKNGDLIEYDDLAPSQRKLVDSVTGGAETYDQIGGTPTKYSQYTLPGGENYREILIQAPSKNNPTKAKEIKDKAFADYDAGKISLEERNKKLDELGSITGNNYQSSHWSEPNVISHIRMNERTVDGKKYAFMEELQSDWAREGRDKGFITTNSGSEISELKAIIQKKTKGEKRTSAEISRATELTEKLKQEFPEWKNQYSSFDSYILNKEAVVSGQIPNNPLLKNWQIPTTKRALIEAVDSGADRFAWINGEQTSARYNLATHLDEVTWSMPRPKGDKIVDLSPKGGKKIFISIDESGTIKRSETGQDNWIGKKLDEVLGKGLADKIMEKETGTLSGDGLSFGGEWANNLYDRQVRDIVKKLTGAEVKTVDMGLGSGKKESGWMNLVPSDIKVGATLTKGTPENYAKWTVTEVLSDGRFKAIPKNIPDIIKGEIKEKTFDLSTHATQQYIDLTPEVKAKIQSKAPNFKMKNPSAGESLPLLLLLLGGGTVVTTS